jgi:putative tributyrin esterase
VKSNLRPLHLCTQRLTALLAACLCAFTSLSARGAAPGKYPELKSGITTVSISASCDLPSQPGDVAVDIYVPETGDAMEGDVLVLPGWNFSRTRWQKETGILKEAESFRFRLIFPDMGRTLYESAYYTETSLKWGPCPGGRWVQKRLIPELQAIGLLRKDGINFIMGLSTGGRGVALISLNNPGLFRAGASLSGDFDQSALPADRLMTRVYGHYAEHKQRWVGADNPQMRIGEWKMPLYLGHGRKDTVVPLSQTLVFHEQLKNAHPVLKIVLNTPESAAHDFTYWGSEVGNVFSFFKDSGK